jgi:hypothetical protein
MADRFRSLLVYAAIFATIFAGGMHMSVWAVCAAACLLSLLGLQSPESATAAGRARTMHSSDATHLFASALNGSTIAAAAFAFGRFSGWFWGL